MAPSHSILRCRGMGQSCPVRAGASSAIRAKCGQMRPIPARAARPARCPPFHAGKMQRPEKCQGMPGRGIILKSLLPIHLTTIALTLDFSRQTTDRESPRICGSAIRQYHAIWRRLFLHIETKRRTRKGLCPHITQMNADEGVLFSVSA